MFFLVSIFSFAFFQISSECELNVAVWTYYPCSFIISPTSLYCPYVSINSTIDQCTNREITFFWHYPFGNMSLTFQSSKNRPFLLRLPKSSLLTNKLIKNIYHHINNKTSEEQLTYEDRNEMITLYSDKNNQCSIKFETTNPNIFDYGTFIRMTILTYGNEKL